MKKRRPCQSWKSTEAGRDRSTCRGETERTRRKNEPFPFPKGWHQLPNRKGACLEGTQSSISNRRRPLPCCRQNGCPGSTGIVARWEFSTADTKHPPCRHLRHRSSGERDTRTEEVTGGCRPKGGCGCLRMRAGVPLPSGKSACGRVGGQLNISSAWRNAQCTFVIPQTVPIRVGAQECRTGAPNSRAGRCAFLQGRCLQRKHRNQRRWQS